MRSRDPVLVQASPRLVMVFATASIPEGFLARGLLESEGIDVLLKGESEGPYRTGPVYLWVSEEREAQARELLSAARQADQRLEY